MNYRDRIIELIADHPRWPMSAEHEATLNEHQDQRELNSVRGLAQMLATLPPLHRVVEVGCFLGVSTECLALFCEELLAVDPWQPGTRFDVYEQFKERMRHYAHVTVLREPSPQAAAHVEDGSLDLVYIDAMHTQKECEADIRAWLPKVRQGGWIAGHDYATYPGTWMENVVQVIPAVRAELGEPDAVFPDSTWLKQVST